MQLSFKDVQFIVDALDYRIEAYRELLRNQEDLAEDEVSDISNNCGFLEALRKDLAKSLSQGELPKVGNDK
ncbi:hypothetical protein ACE1CI_22505 [Aerosakkonemataceae cyanobacterium BLCC-F50]|uniref:Phage protein n=1 Tax=Floridaenema flaviceps BLCC-F50 TaxID=3153642 RepID=A0ABV4XVG5_9CYAN